MSEGIPRTYHPWILKDNDTALAFAPVYIVIYPISPQIPHTFFLVNPGFLLFSPPKMTTILIFITTD